MNKAGLPRTVLKRSETPRLKQSTETKRGQALDARFPSASDAGMNSGYFHPRRRGNPACPVKMAGREDTGSQED